MICNSSSHVEVFISAEKGTGGAHGHDSGVYLAGDGTVSPSSGHIYRIKESVASTIENLDSTFTTATSKSSSSLSANLSNFYFNGIPDGKYSVAHTSILSKIIDLLATIADYIIGLLTYIIRMVIVGWTAIFDNLFNWTVNTIVDTGTDSSEIGMDSVEVNSADSDTRITIEKLFYNGLDLTDINIFTDD